MKVQGIIAGDSMTGLSVIITMAGEGSRFFKAGYNVPKFMISVKGRTLFDWSLDSLTGLQADAYVFIVQKKHNAKQFIEEHTKHLSNCIVNIVEITQPTDGQATTAMIASEGLDDSSALLIYNIDTYVEPPFDCIPSGQFDGYIPCFNASGDHWSFVDLDNRGYANRITEKERISDNCSIGAYYFSSVSLFRELYREYYSNQSHLVCNEKYIAPMYNLMIEKKYRVGISIIDCNKVHVLGTPEELEFFIKVH